MLTRHRARQAVSGVSLIALSALAQPALAATFTVSTETELAAAISTANSNGEANTINVSSNITLTAPLPPLGLRNASGQPLATSPLTINGNGNTISGSGSQRIFFANAGEIAINDVTLVDGRAKGGDGGLGWAGVSGGGGLGAGGALFVRGADAGAGTGAAVTLSGVAFAGNTAVGGNGGTDAFNLGTGAGGGGGLGGDGGASGSVFGEDGGGGGAFAGQHGSPGRGGGANPGAPGSAVGDLSGGGGGALGGGLFVAEGGSLTIAGGSIAGGNVAAGAGGATSGSSSSGQAAGTGMFLQGSGAVTFSPIAGKTVTISDVISDEQGFLAATPGYAAPSGFNAGAWSLKKTGTGTLTLSGANSYTGGTTLSQGTLSLGNNKALGSGTLVAASGTTTDIHNGVDISNVLTIDRDFAINVGAGSAGTYSGPASETSSASVLRKTGTGTLTLSGVNAYTGGTRIDAGTLSVASTFALVTGPVINNAGAILDISSLVGAGLSVGSLEGAGNVALGSRQLTLGGSGGNQHIGGVIKDGGVGGGSGGRLVKAGTGTLTLSGANSYTGGTSVDAGTLVVGVGSILGPVEVKSGARLGGSGAIGGNVTVNAGASHGAGNSVGVQTINGNYANHGILEVEATPSGADRLNVNGTVDISGAALNLLLSPPTSSSWSVLNGPFVLIANDGADAVTGAFASVGDLNKLVFLDHLINYSGGDGNDVTLTLSRNDVAVGDVGQSRNQIASGTAVDSLALNNPIRAALMLSTDEGQVRTALDALSGEVHASLSGSFIEAGGQLRDAASNRIRSAFGDVAASDLPVMAYGPGGAEFVAADFGHNSGGMLAGGDAIVGDSFRLGLFAGYSRTSFDAGAGASSGSSDNVHLGVYGGRHFGAVALRAGASYTRHAIDTTRTVSFPGLTETLKASYDAGTAQAFVEAGYRAEMGRVAFEPFAGLAYVSTSTDGFTETGGSAALTSTDKSFDSTTTTLGLRAATDFNVGDGKATLRGGLGWRHAFGDVAPASTVAFVGGGDSFIVHGAPIARDALLIEAGLDFAIAPKANLGLSYTGQLASGARDHSVKASLGVKF